MTLVVRSCDQGLLEQHLNYHFAQGVDVVLLVACGVSDQTRAVVDEFVALGRVVEFEQPPAARWLHQVRNSMGEFAVKTLGARAVFHSSVDEFWVSRCGDLGQEIGSTEASVLRVPVRNVMLRDNHRAECVLSDAANVVTTPVTVADQLQHMGFVNPYLCPYWPKTIVSGMAGPVRVGPGAHYPADFGRLTEWSNDVVVLHYPVTGWKAFAARIEESSRSQADSAWQLRDPGVGSHWQWWQWEYERKEGRRVYRQLLLGPELEFNLQRAGVTTPVTRFVQVLAKRQATGLPSFGMAPRPQRRSDLVPSERRRIAPRRRGRGSALGLSGDQKRYVIVTGSEGGLGNLGDELLQASAKALHRGARASHTVVIPMIIPPRLDDGFLYVRDRIEAFARLHVPVQQIDLVHFYGGGYLNDYWFDDKLWLYRYLREEGLPPEKFAFTGQGLLPLTAARVNELRRVASECRVFGCRDLQYESIGLDACLTFDDTVRFFDPRDTQVEPSANGMTLSVRLADYVGLDADGLGRAVKEAEAYRASAGLKGAAFGMVRNADYSERLHIENALRAHHVTGFEVLDRPKDIVELKRRLRSSRIAITTSYHVAVFALYCGVPAIGLFANEYYRCKFEGLEATINSPFFRATPAEGFSGRIVDEVLESCAEVDARQELVNRLLYLQSENQSTTDLVLSLLQVSR